MDTLSDSQALPVPPEQPLPMPTHDLGSRGQRRRGQLRWFTVLARFITFGGCAALSAYGINEMHQVVASNGTTPLEWLFMGLFAVTFCWISFPASAAVAGVLRPPDPLSDRDVPDTFRVALLMPVYNEDPSETSAALEVMARALAARGRHRNFEIFILSDTTRPDVWLTETAAVSTLRDRLRDVMPVWYRRRRDNIGRKAGNLREFVERWGGRYEAMVVLDADSLMSADAIIALARQMAHDHDLGILQTVPTLAGGSGLFARTQQFAGRVYGPVVARGTAAWQGNDGNYWGHNAIIRLRAFAQASGLPRLPGRKPLGGDILSHDFVEAALVRKAGWCVSMLPDLPGSWENSPPSLLDVAVRDRRWAQGNVQHLAVLPARGLAWPNRVHFLIGVMSYAASPLWLMLILVGLVLSGQAALSTPDYFADTATLFPQWPSFDSERMLGLFIFSLAVLLVPKAIGALRVMLHAGRRRAAGGGPRFLGSVALEILLSALYAPIMMLIQTRQLWEILLGRDAGWSLQQRNSLSIAWGQIVRRHWHHCLIGSVATVALWLFLPPILPWMLPVVVGLVLAIPLSGFSGSHRAGQWLQAAGYLLIPEESERPAEFDRRAQLGARYRRIIDDATLEHFMASPTQQRRHFRVAGMRHARRRGSPDTVRLTTESKVADAHDLRELVSWLTPAELMKLLSDPALFKRVGHRQERAAS